MSRPLYRDDTNPPLSNWLLKDAAAIKNLPGGSREGSGYSISHWAVTGYCLPKLYVCSPPPPRPSVIFAFFPPWLSRTKGGCSERGGKPWGKQRPGQEHRAPLMASVLTGLLKDTSMVGKEKEGGRKRKKKMSHVCINFLNPKLETSACSYYSYATKTSQYIHKQRVSFKSTHHQRYGENTWFHDLPTF